MSLEVDFANLNLTTKNFAACTIILWHRAASLKSSGFQKFFPTVFYKLANK